MDWVKDMGPILASLEHRYFGLSTPPGFNATTATPDEWSPLTMNNTLLDSFNFIEWIKKTVPEVKDSKVIVIGGSYGGTLTTLLHVHYPETFYGALPSAPLLKSFDPDPTDPDSNEWWRWISNVYLDASATNLTQFQQDMHLCEPYPQSSTDWKTTLLANSTREVLRIPAQLYSIQPFDQCLPWNDTDIFSPNAVVSGVPWQRIQCFSIPANTSDIPAGNIFPQRQNSSDIATLCESLDLSPSFALKSNEEIIKYYRFTKEDLLKTKHPTSAVGSPTFPLSDDREDTRSVLMYGNAHTEEIFSQTIDSSDSVKALFAILQVAGVFYEVGKGFGKSEELITPGNYLPIQKAAYASDILYIVALFFSKSSTAFLFLRLTPRRSHFLAIWATIWLSIAWVLISIILVAIRCHPQHPWLDTNSTCSNLFARWQFIGALDIILELALFAISLFLVWGIQMPLKSKSIVVGSFATRLPIRLYYLHLQILSSNPSLHGGPQAASCTQIQIGYSILASIVPCLKNFMAAYDKPIATQLEYKPYGYGSNRDYTHELASVASKSEMRADVKMERSGREFDAGGKGEFDGTGMGESGLSVVGGIGIGIGRLRPEQIIYEARVTHPKGEGGGEGARELEDRRSLDSGNSRRMIIRKGLEWSVNYDAKT
ncbi:hypothetical protein EG329_008819 [Mollisiaceae sp. DMI_Dod_QoI]|nr:hypothetical protein EG329_008819 [Helotiales sp. DMI_Dod_QoI]